MKNSYILIILSLTSIIYKMPAFAEIKHEANKVVLFLSHPKYENKELSTEQGGVVSIDDLRIQASKIKYVNEPSQNKHFLICEKNILINLHHVAITGEKLYFDFNSMKGQILNGRASYLPWFFIGDIISFNTNGNLKISNSFFTICEGGNPVQMLFCKDLLVNNNNQISAKHISLKVYNKSILSIPYINANISTVKIPISLRVHKGKIFGKSLGIKYNIYSENHIKSSIMVDALFDIKKTIPNSLDEYKTKGIGFGSHLSYHPKHKEIRSTNDGYFVYKPAKEPNSDSFRYRAKGDYFNHTNPSTTVKFSYDVSDSLETIKEVDHLNDYRYAYASSQDSYLQISSHNNFHICSFKTKIKANSFQTINQELPSFHWNIHPICIPKSKLLFDGDAYFQFLKYSFNKENDHSECFSSGRIELNPRLFRNINFRYVNITPEIGLNSIVYSSSENSNPTFSISENIFIPINSEIEKYYQNCSHKIKLYCDYKQFSKPILGQNDPYIFSLQDAKHSLKMISIGSNHGFSTIKNNKFKRLLYFDVWSNVFFNNKGNANNTSLNFETEINPTSKLFLNSFVSFDSKHKNIKEFNIRALISPHADIALSLEYRNRSPFCWRKVNYYNFILEQTRLENDLINSPASDQRHTFLSSAFIRLTPDCSFSVSLRQGEHSKNKKSFCEFDASSQIILLKSFSLKIFFQKLENDFRCGLSLQSNLQSMHTKTKS